MTNPSGWGQKSPARHLSMPALLALLLVTGVSGPTLAQLATNEPAKFNIAAQSLETAREDFGVTSRMQVLYETSLTDGRRSTEVQGTFSHEAALRRLLSGTGLDFTYTEERAFTLVYARRVSPRPIRDFYSFLGGVQTRIISVLCRHSRTRPGAFRIAMQFRIRPDGRIEKPRLLSSTGAARRDGAIAAVLANLAVGSAPPADMPQPVTMILRPGAPNGTDECPSGPRP